MPQLKEGILIAVEGIDGSGKTTLARNLFSLLYKKEFDVLLTKEPGGTELGKKIRELVQNQTIPLFAKTEYLLFASDRAQHFAELIIPALEQKQLILSDRLADSSLAYQGYGRGLDISKIQTISNWAMNDITPHLTIFVTVPVEVALERVNQRRTLSAFEQHKEFLQRVADGFEMLYKNRNDVIIIDGTQPQETIATHAFNAIEQWILNNNFLI